LNQHRASYQINESDPEGYPPCDQGFDFQDDDFDGHDGRRRGTVSQYSNEAFEHDRRY